MKPLTEAEEKMLVHLKGCERCPSVDELADALHHSKSYIFRVLAQLETKGFVACITPDRKRRAARSLVLTPLAYAQGYNPYFADLSGIPTETLRAAIQEREAA